MMRPQQISKLSSSARSFFLSGSRSSAADGSSSSAFNDDEPCVSRRQQAAAQAGKLVPSSVVPKPLVVGSILPKDVDNKPVVLKKVDGSGRPSLLPHSVTYASTEASSSSSEPIGDQIFRAGVAAVSILSDLANFKLPSSDGGSEVFGLGKRCMVDPARPITSVKSSNVKVIRREDLTKSYPRSSAAKDSSSIGSKIRNTSSNFRGAKEAGFVKGFKQVSTQKRYHHTSGKRTSMLQRHNVDSNRFVPSGSALTSSSRQYCNNIKDVENVSSILKTFRWGPAAEEALKNLRLTTMGPYQANQVLKKMNDYGNALGFFYWLKRQPKFKHDEHTYTTMVGNLGRAKQFRAINKLLDEMVRDGCRPNTVTYNRLIHSYGRANYLNEAMNVFNQMQEAGCKPDRVTYCTLIDIHAKAGFLDIAMDMHQRMEAAGISTDTFTYSVIINCLGKAGHLPAAHKLFCEMVDQGCTPNLVTYNIMIDLHAKARNYQSSLKLYRDMQNAGFKPDKVTYSIVMEVLGHCGYLEEAEGVFTEMQEHNWIPDEPVYGLLVDLWGKAGNVEKAWYWYQAMLHAGLLPNVPTCNSLLSTFLRVDKIGEAYELLQNMLSFGLRPSLQTYTLLLSCCTDGRSKLDMSYCGQLMASTGHPAHMFLLKMPSASPDGQNVRNHVNSFLDLMHSEDRESKRGLVDAVVDFLHKSGQREEAGSVWEVAAQKNVFPDAVREKSSSYWLINLHVMSEGTAVTALSRTLAWFRKQMLVSGSCPSRIDIVTGWGRRSRVTGTSMVRQAVEELLNMFGSPFYTESGNSGCFVGCGESLNRWLLQSYVERMHLI
ncbi:unnamed protein product [Eruca vesicaria subsp. sativa]|uniref:Smr domain-containing protein n=1 Tax=Eruca vesicaria subsp. sativa TaxID=29727 RepID=A0ABC8LCE2_ERUVS|nr:unnamed protein product [Eruca vesicaria subsp. sativa]